MRTAVTGFALAGLLAGCGVSEAERFGYKGADLEPAEDMFFTTGQSVTNWVPARVLSVMESYDLAPEEAELIRLAGVVAPGEPLERIPDGYQAIAEEPWFTTWSKDAENFGFRGVNGFISHFNEDRGLWETSETYFSSYWPDREKAVEALAVLKAQLGEKCAPKKFYEFTDCWVAEYIRLRVMGVVGQKPDGTWSCMLDINDKNRAGCGQWEMPEDQAARRAEHEYRKALAKWKTEKDRVVVANHDAVEKLRTERGIPLFGDGAKSFDAEDGRKVYVRGGAFDMTNVVNTAIWAEKLSGLEHATGTEFTGEMQKQDVSDRYTVWSASWKSDIYEVRLDMAFPTAGERGEWRELCFEIVQDGFEIPPRPVIER